MFRIGECFVGMERPDAAEAFFDGVIRNFPNTDAAKEASTRLGR
jgi:TolA-binding protein